MWDWILWTVVGLVALGVVALLALVLAMRTKNQRGLTVVRRFTRWANRLAGEPGKDATYVRHVGRRSGKPYTTRIDVYPMDDGFLAFLPYGTGADWVRNVRSAASVELVVEGRSYVVVAPQIVGPAAAWPYLSTGDRWVARIFGVTDFLVLQRAPVAAGGGA